MKLSDNFTIHEFEYSRTAYDKGIDNRIPKAALESLRFTAAGMERIRAYLDDNPIRVTSGYRCFELNEAVKGSKKSQHMRGEAVDFVCPRFGTPHEICKHLEPMLPVLGIDQLIMEGTWVHVSFTLRPRYEVLTRRDGKYLEGIV